MTSGLKKRGKKKGGTKSLLKVGKSSKKEIPALEGSVKEKEEGQ